MARDRCTQSDCAAFRSLTNRQQLVSNMDERVYDGLVMRYSASWNAPTPMAASGAVDCTRALHAHRQAHQCRVSVGGLDPAGQHHDARAGDRNGAGRAARAGAGECAAAVAAPGNHHHGDRAGGAGRGQKQPAPKSSRAGPVQLAPAAPAPAADDE